MTVSVRFISDGELRSTASAFLNEHHPDLTAPIPIEDIVEFGLGLDIVPVIGLLESDRGIHGYITPDKTEIRVDQFLLEKRLNKYRFTLAHEIGHVILHGHMLPVFGSDAEWLEFRRELDLFALQRFEYQANVFAGLVLVPPDLLRTTAIANFRALAKRIPKNERAKVDLSGEPFWEIVAAELGSVFQVASTTARICLQRDRLWQTDLSAS